MGVPSCSTCGASAGTVVDGKRVELRPYGKGGSLVCFPCGMADIETTEASFRSAIDRADAEASNGDVVVFGDIAGPRVHPLRGGRQ